MHEAVLTVEVRYVVNIISSPQISKWPQTNLHPTSSVLPSHPTSRPGAQRQGPFSSASKTSTCHPDQHFNIRFTFLFSTKMPRVSPLLACRKESSVFPSKLSTQVLPDLRCSRAHVQSAEKRKHKQQALDVGSCTVICLLNPFLSSLGLICSVILSSKFLCFHALCFCQGSLILPLKLRGSNPFPAERPFVMLWAIIQNPQMYKNVFQTESLASIENK